MLILDGFFRALRAGLSTFRQRLDRFRAELWRGRRRQCVGGGKSWLCFRPSPIFRCSRPWPSPARPTRQVQAIGGVNEKIEGFLDVCRWRGGRGGEAVGIPSANVRDLVLRSDVVEGVRGGQFRVYAVERVEQAVELLLGVPAGNRLEDGLWEENTVFGRVQDRLHYYAERMKEFGKTDLPPHESPETDVAAPGSPELPPATERTRFSRPAWR